MPNPPDSEWFATPRALRHRKPLSVTLSDKARERLERLAAKEGVTLSAAVEALVLAPSAPVEIAIGARPSGESEDDAANRLYAEHEAKEATREAKGLGSKPRGKTAKKTPTKRVGLTADTTSALRSFVQERVATPPAKAKRAAKGSKKK